MRLLDDFVINAKSVASKLSKKAGKALDISKLKLSAAEITAEINKNFRELGNLVFLSKREGADSEIEIENLLNEIETLYDALDSVNDGIIQLRKKRICPVCNGVNPAEALFCNSCGSMLGEDEAKEAPEEAYEEAQSEVDEESKEETEASEE